MLGQFLVDPLSLRYLQPLQNSNFKFKQCLKPTDEGYSEIKGTLFAIFKIIRQKERHYGILLKSKSEELIYLFYYYRLVERKSSSFKLQTKLLRKLKKLLKLQAKPKNFQQQGIKLHMQVFLDWACCLRCLDLVANTKVKRKTK